MNHGLTWFGWVLVVDYAISALYIIGRIGKPRERITPAYAVITVLCTALYILGVVTIGTVR